VTATVPIAPYRDLLEQVHEGAVVLTTDGRIRYSNASFAAIVGEPFESLSGSRIDRFVNAADIDDFKRLLSERHGSRRIRLIGSNARTLQVSVTLTTTTSIDGDRQNLIVTDLSELLEARNGREGAERASRAKDEFLATLAHELRSPLGAIGNAVQVIELTHAEGEMAARAHAAIARQVGVIAHLIDDLLDVERVVSGKIRLNRQPVDMAEAVRRAVFGFTGDARLDRDIDVTLEPVWVDGDAMRLDQVLTNLVTNAVKYTPAGGHIRVALCAEGDEAVFSVEDTGFGISPELLPSIFDLYTQADRTIDNAQGGLGIGLALVRRLVELHGGTIAAASAGEGHGSLFTLRLARIPAEAASAAKPFSPERRAKPRRVLVIEDSQDARDMLRMMLELAGHVVYDAPDGVRGLELLNAVRPDVGIIDIGLPEMDGYQVAQRIRAEPHGRGMLLLALTGDEYPDDSTRRLEPGFDFHLVKPVDSDRLARLLGEHAGRHNGDRGFSDSR
jgi:signal transduction histidine kinase/ActR/RegA family two-component response regulator